MTRKPLILGFVALWALAVASRAIPIAELTLGGTAPATAREAPEPPTLLLFGGGFLLFGISRRKRA